MKKYFFLLIVSFVFLDDLSVFASENERYRAFPMATGGYVFILDTREGHIWTWSNTGPEQVSSSGQNPRILYQGNIRKNMTVPPKSSVPPEASGVKPSRH